MRLNEGMPVWHASVSLQHRKRGFLVAPDDTERYGLEVCRGVGGDREWWFYNVNAEAAGGPVGHLRVNVTPAEAAMIPAGLAVHDAGESGPERPRTIL